MRLKLKSDQSESCLESKDCRYGSQNPVESSKVMANAENAHDAKNSIAAYTLQSHHSSNNTS